ncbi:MAG: CCA tRNA nucleotidyltransferase, partial [Hyphomicrobiales bacterium]|nr:CCA tRNA nucleotidyltransferase [Hyphomicrobiales bacterium]
RRLHAAAGALERLHGRATPPQGTELAELVFARGADAVVDALVLAHAESAASPVDAAWRTAREAAQSLRELKLPVSGDDLKQRG